MTLPLSEATTALHKVWGLQGEWRALPAAAVPVVMALAGDPGWTHINTAKMWFVLWDAGKSPPSSRRVIPAGVRAPRQHQGHCSHGYISRMCLLPKLQFLEPRKDENLKVLGFLGCFLCFYLHSPWSQGTDTA